MFKCFDFCLPTKPASSQTAPTDCTKCYRLRLERDGDRVRPITRGGYNWTKRYPWIVEAARKNRHKQFVIDGEAVVLCVDGVADFIAAQPQA
jgi:ATP-dependent DNA ligase